MVDENWADKLRETEELFRTTVENLPINMVLYDRDYRDPVHEPRAGEDLRGGVQSRRG